MHLTAKLALSTFCDKLTALFPEATDDVSALSTSESSLARSNALRFALLLGALKGKARIRAKIEQFRKAKKSESAEWVFTTKVRADERCPRGAFEA